MTHPNTLSALKDEVQRARFEAIARLAAAFTNPVRIQLVACLMQVEEQSVDGLANRVGQSRANTSAQLKILHNANIVRYRRSGRQVLYRIADEGMRTFWLKMQDRAAESDPVFSAMVQSFYESPEHVDALDAKALLERVRKNEVVLLDVRSKDEFADGHIPGAMSVPLSELETRLDELLEGREIVAYCRGRYCVEAVQAVRLLRTAGRAAKNLGVGVTEWSAVVRVPELVKES
ncbi:MAG: metalloregulator ArsR/SmtB family transcription factor [Bradymonadia bacterium]